MKCKRFLSALAAAVMASTMLVASPFAGAAESLPTPDYRFTFQSVSGTSVASSGTLTGTATLKGSASVVSDSAVPSADGTTDVLKLNGDGAGTASLTLPEDLFANVDDGMTISMLVKPSTSATAYMKLFDANAAELGNTYSGVNSWSSPDFALAVGGEVYDTTIYTGTAGSAATATCKINYSQHLTKGSWQLLTVTMDSSSYHAYIDGTEISYQDAQQSTGTVATIMKALFAEGYLQSLTHSSLGQSFYTSDNDFKGSIDDFALYSEVLSAEQVSALYQTYQTSDTDEGAVASFDLSKESTLSQSATGFLYGTAEIGVPSISLVQGLNPSFLVQKAMDGQQHPSGDAVRTSSALTSAGVTDIQVYLQDYYLEWPYDAPTTSDGSIDVDSYQKTVESILYSMICEPAEEGDEGAFLGSDGSYYVLNTEKAAQYNYVLFNEPDTIWYSNNTISQFCAAWKQIYDAVHAIDPNAKCAGPNTTNYVKSWNITFFAYTYENDCLPEIITWHELFDGGNLSNSSDPNDSGMKGDSTLTFYNHYADMMTYVEKYYSEDNQPKLLVNEYALYDDIGSPGRLVKWLSMFEDKDVAGCMAYWGLADTLNEMAADQNMPNSTWWLYHWYAQMTGVQCDYIFNNDPDATDAEKAEAFYNAEDTYYGLTSYDADNSIAYTIFGGSTLSDSETIKLTNMDSTNLVGDSGSVNVKVYGVGYSGQMGSTAQPQVIYDGSVAVENGTLTFTATDTDEMDAYFAVITPTDEAGVSGASGSLSTLSYEAEDATLLGGATVYTKTGTGDMATSGRAIVGSINNNGDGVSFTVTVPQDGTYKLGLFYSLQAPYVDAQTLEPDGAGQNRAIGQTLPYGMQVDDYDQQTIYLESTVKWDYKTHYDTYVALSAGTHTITFTHINGDQGGLGNLQLVASIDKLDLDYVTDEDTLYDFSVDTNLLANTSTGATVSGQELTASDGSTITFTAVAPKAGVYSLAFDSFTTLSGSPTVTLSMQGVDYASDANSYSTVSLYNTEVLTAEQKSNLIYLPQGASTLTLSVSGGSIDLGAMHFYYAGESDGTVIDASDLTIYGTNAYLESQEYATSSDGMVLTELGIGQDVSRTDLTDEENKAQAEANYAEVKVNASEAGTYSLAITYSNDEPAPVMLKSDGTTYVHPYNVDLVERFMQIKVNDSDPETVYFRNTYSWDSYKTTELLVTLEKGENTIRLYNDNSYQFSALVNSTAPVISTLKLSSLTASGEATLVSSTSTAEIDTSKLESKLAAYEERELYQNCYTAESWAKAEAAAQSAQEALKNASSATQSEINAAAAALSDALDVLETVSVPVTADDLLAYYSFDSTLTDSVSGDSATVLGATANATGGSASYTTSPSGATGSGKAYNLTGSNGLKLDNPITSEEYTVAFWYKTTNSPLYTGAVFIGDTAKWISIGRGWLTYTGPMSWSYDGSDNYYDNYPSTAQITTGAWNHIAVSAKDGQATIYVNGNAICSGGIAQIASQVENIFIGVNYWDTAIKGGIDELYIYGAAMSASEVAALCEGSAPETPEVDKTDLLSAMLEAAEADSSAYTTAKAEAVAAAMETANTAYTSESATQEQVDAAAQALTDALNLSNMPDGDMNGDGEVTVQDVMLLAQYAVGQDVTICSNGDLTGDGEIDINDVMALAQIAAG